MDAETFTVSTFVDGAVVDEQSGITNVSDLSPNSWVTFSGTGAVAAASGQALTGELVLAADNGRVYIEQDINSLTTLGDLPEAYRYNKTIRLCNTIANDIYRQFSANYIGLVNNNDAGRSQFQAAIVGYLLDVQGNQGIQNFSASDVEVLPGDSLNAVVVNVAIQPVGTVEKIYMTVVVS